MAEGLSSPIFLKYLEIYEKNPRSRVFAPLAEHYRQIGMLEKAIDILKKGIKTHPSYVMGHLGLAFCYFDQRQFNLTYNILKPLLTGSRDNIRLQRLFAKSCLEIEKFDEALDVFKYILFVSPRDAEAAEYIKYLEKGELARVIKSHEPVLFEDEEKHTPTPEEMRKTFELENINVDPNQDHGIDGWRRVDFTKMAKSSAENVKRPAAPQPELFKPETKEEFLERNLGPRLVQPEKTPPQITSKRQDNEAPFMTHTLVDLYCSQGHVNKAVEILEKMLELNPSDERTVHKLQEVTSLLHSSQEFGYSKTELEKEKILVKNLLEEDVEEKISPQIENETRLFSLSDKSEPTKDEEIGRQELMNLLEQKLKKTPNIYLEKVESRMNHFLGAIQKRSQQRKILA